MPSKIRSIVTIIATTEPNPPPIIPPYPYPYPIIQSLYSIILKSKTIDYRPVFFNLSEFKTTLILLNAMATAAKIGLSKTLKNGYRIPAATGIKAML